MRWLLTTFLLALAPSGAFAWNVPKNDEEAKVLYDRLDADFQANLFLHNTGMNLARDGKRSSYLDSKDPFQSQAEPLATNILDILPEAQWVPYPIFNQAIRGLRQILANFPNGGIRSDVLTLVDFGLKTESRRFLVLDLIAERVLFQTWVHHGRKSDQNLDRLPETFSNVVNSNTSSAGFLLASDLPYQGQWGYSLRMHGIDGDLNSHVHERAMVIHPWPTIHPRDLARLNAYEQASLGCLSLPYYESGKFYGRDDHPLSKLIIDTIKKRSVIFAYTPSVDLEKRSLYLRSTDLLPEEQRTSILAKVNDESSNQIFSTTEDSILPSRYSGWRGR